MSNKESECSNVTFTARKVQANTGKVHKCLFHICYEEQNCNILQIQIQGLSSTFKGLEFFFLNSSIFKDFSSTLWTLYIRLLMLCNCKSLI